MANFLGDLFDSVTNQQATPQQTILDPAQTAAKGYGIATGLAPQVAAYQAAYQPIITGTQLNSENQVFGPQANQLQKGTYQSILDNLNLGSSVPQDLQDLITTNTLSQLGRSGVGTADAGKLFGARSLLSAGLDLGAQRRAEALRATGMLPSSTMTPGNQLGALPNADEYTNALYKQQAQQDQYANIVENTRRENFSNLINTGGRILGTAAGAFFGGPMGAQIGGQIGGSLGGHTGVAGYSSGGGGGGGGGGFTSILSGLFSGGGGGGSPGLSQGYNGGSDSAGGFGGGGFGAIGYA